MIGHAVYALCDPTSGAARYIGYSKDAYARYRGHLRDNSKAHKARWVNKLLREGVAPKLRVLCFVQGAREAKRVEVALIAAYRQRGARLTNGTDGGDGTSGMEWTAEMRAKARATKMGRVVSAETRARLGASWTPERRAAFSNKNPGARPEAIQKKKDAWTAEKKAEFGRRISRRLTSEHQRKMTAAAALAWNDERRAKIGKAQKGRVKSAVHRARISESLKGRKLSPEHCKKISSVHKGRPKSPEHRAKIGAAVKATLARRAAERLL